MTKSATREAADSVDLSLTGGTMTGDTAHGDNVKAKFGTGNDLNIYHDGSDSYIKDDGTGSLWVASNEFRVANAGVTENMIIATENAAVKLYHNNALKLETTATGVAVTGGVALGGTAAANTLDDYEEGTWTPVIQNTTGTFITSEAFNYVKVGKVVTTRGYIYNGNVASASAVWQFGGLPFQPLREAYGVVQFYVVNIPGDSAWVNVYANPTSSYIRLIATRDAGTSDSLQWSDVGTGHVDFHLTYLTT